MGEKMGGLFPKPHSKPTLDIGRLLWYQPREAALRPCGTPTKQDTVNSNENTAQFSPKYSHFYVTVIKYDLAGCFYYGKTEQNLAFIYRCASLDQVRLIERIWYYGPILPLLLYMN